jgi:hypothetical protein
MPKRILAGTFAAAVLGLGACDYNKQDYNQANADYGADYNAEEANYADNGAAYDNMAGNMSNEVGNMDNGTAGNETANEATTNTGY